MCDRCIYNILTNGFTITYAISERKQFSKKSGKPVKCVVEEDKYALTTAIIQGGLEDGFVQDVILP